MVCPNIESRHSGNSRPLHPIFLWQSITIRSLISIHPRCIYLHIDIAERPTKRAHRILNRNIPKRILKHRTQRQRIIQRTLPTRRVVLERDSTINRISPVLEILVLPDPPSSVNLGVVLPEVWIGWGVVEV